MADSQVALKDSSKVSVVLDRVPIVTATILGFMWDVLLQVADMKTSVWVVWVSAAFWIVALSIQVGRWRWGKTRSYLDTSFFILAASIVPVLLTFKAAESVRERLDDAERTTAEETKRHQDEEAFRISSTRDLAETKAQAASSALTILRMMTEPDGQVSPEILLKKIGAEAAKCVLDHFQLGWKLFLTNGTDIARRYKEVPGIHDEYIVDSSPAVAQVTNDNQLDFVPPTLYLNKGPGKKPEFAIGSNEVRSPPIDMREKCRIVYGVPLERTGLYGGAVVVARDEHGYLIAVGLGYRGVPFR